MKFWCRLLHERADHAQGTLRLRRDTCIDAQQNALIHSLPSLVNVSTGHAVLASTTYVRFNEKHLKFYRHSIHHAAPRWLDY